MLPPFRAVVSICGERGNIFVVIFLFLKCLDGDGGISHRPWQKKLPGTRSTRDRQSRVHFGAKARSEFLLKTRLPESDRRRRYLAEIKDGIFVDQSPLRR